MSERWLKETRMGDSGSGYCVSIHQSDGTAEVEALRARLSALERVVHPATRLLAEVKKDSHVRRWPVLVALLERALSALDSGKTDSSPAKPGEETCPSCDAGLPVACQCPQPAQDGEGKP